MTEADPHRLSKASLDKLLSDVGVGVGSSGPNASMNAGGAGVGASAKQDNASGQTGEAAQPNISKYQQAMAEAEERQKKLVLLAQREQVSE